MLLEALSAVPCRKWRLTCAGSLTRDPATAERVRATVARLGLEDRVSLVGDVDGDALAACYDSADVFVLATRQETYGMAVAEALAHGLPVVATTTGAIPELIGEERGAARPGGRHGVARRRALTCAGRRRSSRTSRRGRATRAGPAAHLGRDVWTSGGRSRAGSPCMDESLLQWLRLREPADAAARSERLTHVIADTLPAGAPLCVLDLATGRGSNVRYLAGRLPSPQRWLAVDRSAALLAGLRDEMTSWGVARGKVRTDARLVRHSWRRLRVRCRDAANGSG